MASPKALRCEYRINPLGIDDAQPRLFWQLDDPRRGAAQSAYQIIVASTERGLAEGKADAWDSGRVNSDLSIHVVYQGSPLASGQRYFWKVRIWDAGGHASDWSEAAWWEMGLLRKDDWKGKWVGSPTVGGPYTSPAAPYLRTRFALREKPVRARLYATALGLYEFEINGRRVGEDIFAPGRTEYGKRVPYHVYDVTALLGSGENACGAVLGDGWYCGFLHSDPRQTYGDRPRLLAQIEVYFADGSSQVVVTDGAWKCSDGPIRSSDMLMGEDYDARMELGEWSGAKFDDAKWGSVIVFPDQGIEIVAHRAPPVRRMAEIKPVGPPTVSANKRRWLFDFGQNIVGRVRMTVRGPAAGVGAGRTISLRHAEMLDKDGKPYTQALRSARATDYYTTSGRGEEVYEPRFTFHGFRYVEVRDYPGTPSIDDITGIVLHSDMPMTGSFECSDAAINKLQSNILWSQRGNFLDIPTDCPQRDERLGWTGDAQVFARTAAFNMDVAGFFTKWLQDMADAQGSDGRIPSVVPDVKSIHNEGGPAWADAAVICPWMIYLCFGDVCILRDRYPMMREFMGFLEANCVAFIRADEHWKWKGYGDWLNIDAPTPHDLIGTAFYAYCAQLMSQIATIVGQAADAVKYEKLYDDVRQAWVRRFVEEGGQLVIKTQTAYVLALQFDLLPESMRRGAVDALVADIKGRGMHLSTGFVGTPYLNHVLTRYGRPDVAYALLEQKTFPSWLYPISQGATTMWERWDAWTEEKGFNDSGMNSFNHYAYGAVGDWINSTIVGIELDASKPGYKHVVVAPRPGGGLTHARGTLQSLYGLIESAWRLVDGRLEMDVVIPPNTTATVYVPTADAGSITESGKPASTAAGVRAVGVIEGSVIFEVGAGRYNFVVPRPVVVPAAAIAGK